MQEPTATDLDRAIGFTIPDRDARGRITRLGPVLDSILSAHAYPPAIETLLAEALALTALLGSTLKGEEGQLTLQAQTQNGVVRLMVCDFKAGELRGYEAGRPLDDGIVGARWLTLDEVRATQARHRSPLILRCCEDYLAGRRYPLELLVHYG